MTSFEVLTESGDRFRCEGENRFWQYAAKGDSTDQLDRTTVEIIETDFDMNESRCVLTITSVIAVGEVDALTLMIMPRERRETQCPRCGFCEAKQ